MGYTTLLFLVLFLCTGSIETSNILVFTPSPWKSHIVSFHPLFLELANRGHNVTVVTKYPMKNPPPNYNQVVVTYEFDFSKTSNILMRELPVTYMFLNEPYMRSTIAVENTRMYLSASAVQKFIKEDQSKFDLIIVESFFQEATVAMGHKYGAPVVSIVPVSPWVPTSRWAANPSDLSYIKDFTLDAGKEMDFWARLANTAIGLYGFLIEPITYLPQMEKIMNDCFQYPGYEHRPSMADMLKNISLHLIDSDVMILSPRPYVPSFVEVPGIHLRSYEKMDKRLQDFMDDATAGVVYFNFGTILDVSCIPKDSLATIVNVLGRLEQKIVFKWISNDSRQFPDNFYVDSWLPQRDILKHPNCKVFITHGGVHGIMESIDAGVPLIGFPIFGDQFTNLKASQDDGYGIVNNLFRLTEKKLEKDINRVLTDKKFTDNAKRVSAIFLDRPLSAVDTAVYWVEYVIRHKGAHHLKTAAVHLTWYQYYLIDVFAFIGFVVIFFTYFIYIAIKSIRTSLLWLTKSEKLKNT
ncbi:UDP-glycosyltransferase UGT4-like isoform X2 [Adelges cooleyi]|uniref:UDP-glycosyltransferase UGT4-like isoform X2 n=1 Tax=Adelges cooleyi TaxID=133065 RepID=UPI00217F6FF1|nr:UDP-glycosyltransferase UGT4-like isoform X2 [Adelges cooleyi]